MKFKVIGKNPKDKLKIKVKDFEIGGNGLTIIAGPCAIESEKQMMETAQFVKMNGGKILRGGAFKPRTSPYSFQGLGERGLKYIYKAGKKFNIPVISEIMDARDVQMVSKYVDILQVGSRNMQNFSLLKEL